MPPCKNDPKRKYKGDEPSPKGLGWCAHGEKEGEVRKGRDGNKWVVKKVSSGSLRWVKSVGDSKPIKISVKKNSVKKNSVNKSNKIDCSKFVEYHKKTKSIFGFTKIETLKGLSASKNTLYKYISYNNFEKVATDIPDGFIKSKITPAVIKGHCGNKQFLTKQTAPKINHPKCKKYFTHDNGGRPFLVYVSNKDIFIYKQDDKYEINDDDYDYKNYMNNSWMYTRLVKEYKNVIKIHIGKSLLNPSTKFSGGHGKKFDGNTTLVEISKDRYVIISSTIVEFPLKDRVIKYYSSVGNNDVPYPIILGEKNVYFMLDYKYVGRNYFPDKMTDTDWSDAYSNYYGSGNKNQLLRDNTKYMNGTKAIQKRLW